MDIETIDQEIFLWLNQHVGNYSWLDSIVVFIVSDYLVPISFSFVLFALWIGWRNNEMRDLHQYNVITSITGIILTNVFISIINSHFFRLRPFDVHEVNLLFYMPTDSSFPANPIAVAFAIATGVAFVNKKLAIAMYITSSLYGFARVYAGVFYPSDIVGGAIIGLTSTLLAYFMFKYVSPIPTILIRIARHMYLA